ncbi:MAG: DMT family transporter [Hyphomicrobiales bacterium]
MPRSPVSNHVSSHVSSHVTGIFLALAAALCYGWVPNFARLAFLNGVPALETVTCRTLVVAVVLGVIGLARGDSFAVPPAARKGLVLQMIATFLVSSCYLASVQYLPVTLSVIIFYTFPLMVLVASPLVERHMPRLPQVLIALVGFAGLFIAVGPVFSGANALGLSLAFLGALGCALQFFTGRMVARHMAPTAFGSLVHLAIFPLILGLAWHFGGVLALMAPAGLGPWAIFSVLLVCITYLGGYFLHMSSVQQAPSSVVAPYFNAEPVVSTTLAFVVLGETMTRNQLLGGGLVLAALLAGSMLQRRQVAHG